jgi:hypothetical protein
MEGGGTAERSTAQVLSDLDRAMALAAALTLFRTFSSAELYRGCCADDFGKFQIQRGYQPGIGSAHIRTQLTPDVGRKEFDNAKTG